MAKKSNKAPGRRLGEEDGALEESGGSRVPDLPGDAAIASVDQEQGHQDRPTLEQPLTIAEVALHYRVSERTVRRRIKQGTLQKEPGFDRTVRISVDQLRASELRTRTKS